MSTSVEFRTGTLLRSVSSLSASDVDIAGGKGANLGELVRAGFHVPDSFVLTTAAYDAAANAAHVDPHDPAAAAERLRTSPVPEAVATAAREAYRALGGGRVAVRSSATAEDLPGASFAGQQDTYLGVEGDAEVLDAVRKCWASLWNERAVSYRSANGIDDAHVSLAVVIQRMVEADAAGVLFTADPITGRRGRGAIDAVRGLGDALVSGKVDPDHYLVDARTGEVVSAKGTTLDVARLRQIAEVGAQIEAHYGTPQDIEWAIEGSHLWIVQSRAITTIYPLPASAPDSERDLRVYFSANVAQGVFEPFTAIGLQTFRLMSASLAARLGRSVPDPVAGAPAMVDAGMRIFIDLTDVVCNPFGRRVARAALGIMEARSARLIDPLTEDPRLAVRGSSSPLTLIRVVRTVAHTGLPSVLFRGLRAPDATRERILAEVDAVITAPLPDDLSAADRLDAFQRLFLEWPGRIFPKLVGLVGSGVLPFAMARRILGTAATPAELQTVLRGLPHNPTTEMGLELWRLARDARSDPQSVEALTSSSPEVLAARYRSGTLRPAFQKSLAAFLARYGHRAVGEIDLGAPRWSDDPTHLIGAIAGYLKLPVDAEPPDAQFARGAREAEAMVETLTARVHGPRRVLARAMLRRVRANAGAREQPKNQIIRLFAKGRALLAPVGDELAARGVIASPDDVWHLTLPELRRAVSGDDVRSAVEARRAERRREMARRHIPRLLLSDGTDVEAAYTPPIEGALRGSPASPGTVTAVARVMRSPQGAHLEPGEILVAPSTDPGWTPLFLTAGGLVMEMGGMMSHGAVVAREYGIPAVVGVAGATDRIATGQRITVDGSGGVVAIDLPVA